MNTLNETVNYTELKEKIIDAAPMSIITINKDGYITFVNKYFKNFSNSKSAIGKNIFHMPFFLREKLLPEYKILFKLGKPFTKRNCKTTNVDGELKYLNIIAVPLKNNVGHIDGALSMAVDVTETVQTKIKLRELNLRLEEEVKIKTKEIIATNNKLKKSLELKTHFISDATHELRTPLAIAKLNLELFKNQLPNKKAKHLRDLNAVDHEINKVCDIITDMSFITSIDERSALEIKKGEVNLNKLIESVIERLSTLANKKKMDIIWQKTIEGSTIKGDEKKLETLLTNITRNALKYGKENGWVKIWLGPDPTKKSVSINVLDNGIGIPKKDLPFIFDRFYRSDLSRKSGEGGVGLGLSICKWITEQHNGSIDVKSTVGKGSLFAINLPTEQNHL